MAKRRQAGEGSVYQRSSDGRWIAVVHVGWRDGQAAAARVHRDDPG